MSSAVDRLPNMEGRLICDGKIRIGSYVAHGGWGVVYKGETLGASPQPVAIKCVPRQGFGEYQHRVLNAEIRLHKKVSGKHKGILKLVDTYEIKNADEDILFIVTEYCENGDMFGALCRGEFCGNDQAIKDCFVQIIDAVQAMHKAGVFHRDLKPENVFLKANGEIAIGDFGFATDERYSKPGIGTQHYMSPGESLCILCYPKLDLIVQPQSSWEKSATETPE